MKNTISSLGGKWFQIIFCRNIDNGDSLGNCEVDHHSGPMIRVDISQSHREVVDTLVHEILHAQFPCLKEEAVTQAATEITKALIDTEVIEVEEPQTR